MNKNIGNSYMVKKLIFCFLVGSILLVGCSADDSLSENSELIPGRNNNQKLISENKNSEPGEIELSDFAIIKVDTKYIYRLFDNIYDARSHLGEFMPEVLYKDADDDFYSRLSQTWGHLYIVWVKGNGVILKIVVDGKGYETKRGIGIGNTISDIDEAYGKDSGYRSKDEIEFDLGNEEFETMMALIFHIENEIVVEIEILEGT